MGKVKLRRKWEYEGFGLSMEPVGDDYIRVIPTAEGFRVRYLAHDMDAESPWEQGWDGIGRFVHWKDHGQDERREYERLRGICPDCEAVTERGDAHTGDCDGTALDGRGDAVAIDKYEHGGVAYSVAGTGMNCQWDTSRVWAYWVPDKETVASWLLTDEGRRVVAVGDADEGHAMRPRPPRRLRHR